MSDDRFHALHEIVAEARAVLGNGPWGYLAGGAETETTVARNRAAIDSIAFRPRVLRDVSTIDASATLLDRPVRLPVFVAPVGQLTHFTPGAAATAAEAAAEFGVGQMLSSASPPGIEEVSAAAPEGLRIYQLYVTGDEQFVTDRVKRVENDGWSGFCLTVDVAKYSRRERDIANRWGIRWQTRGLEGGGFLAALSWADVERVRSQTELPLILKGIATPQDAELAIEHGVDVVYVSNHGGRQLDHGLGSIEVLPEIVETVNGRAKVYVDGGFCRGSDIVKGIALGADAIGLGRITCYGLAAGARDGLVRVFELLEDEVHRTLGLLGLTGWDGLDTSYLTAAEPQVEAHVLSAFPLVEL